MSSTEDDPCLGLACCMLYTTDAPPRAGVSSRLSHHSDGKTATCSLDETVTLSAETSPSLAGDDGKEDGGHRSSSTPHYSSPLASIEALEEDDDASSFDDRKVGDGGGQLAGDDSSKIGEDTLAAGLEDAVQMVMANNKATCTVNVNANVAVDVDSKSKKKKKTTRSGAASSFTRSISRRGSALMKRTLSARRPNSTAMSGIDVIDADEVAIIGRDIDALVLEEEEEQIEILTEVHPPQEQQLEAHLGPDALMVLEARQARQGPQVRQVLLQAELVMISTHLNMEHTDQTSTSFLMLKEECLKIT